MANDMVRRLLERVRQLREERGLTQESFAERAGMKYKHYQAIEAGRKIDFRISTLEKLATGCGLEPWKLLVPEEMVSAVAEAQAKYDSSPRRRPRKTRTPKV